MSILCKIVFGTLHAPQITRGGQCSAMPWSLGPRRMADKGFHAGTYQAQTSCALESLTCTDAPPLNPLCALELGTMCGPAGLASCPARATLTSGNPQSASNPSDAAQLEPFPAANADILESYQ